MKSKDIAFAHFAKFAVPTESVGFANVAYNGVKPLCAIGVGYVCNVVIGIVKHGTYQVIHAGIDSGKNCSGGLFDYVDLG